MRLKPMFLGALVGAVVGTVTPASPAGADAADYFDTEADPGSARNLRAGYDLYAGPWIGSPKLKNGSPVFCFVQDDDSYPPSNQIEQAGLWRSELNRPILYRVRPFGSVSFLGDCTWSWMG